ncbi:MAG TPA: DUF4440 domain-containing protein [Woeseiaceae bacterium]|jgi:ketosteroid isomerase-like protein|nr:DUF4440 domain-containing protein [Woeseiaceae bacterium]
MNANAEAEARALMELSRKWSATVGSGDLEAALDYWADDAIMLPPDLPTRSGKAAIRDHVMGAASIPGFRISWEPVSAHVSESGDMAYLIERNVTEMDGEDGEKIVIHGKVVTIWRKDANGEWKNVVDIWNTAPDPDDG